jgi:hypothetical protein
MLIKIQALLSMITCSLVRRIPYDYLLIIVFKKKLFCFVLFPNA